MPDNEFFDPKTGETHAFGPGESPPEGWKPLKPAPDLSGPRDATVTWLPGQEPRLYVNPRTGESRWVQLPKTPPDGWQPVTPRVFPPPGTKAGQYFDPKTGESYEFGPGQSPPEGWKPLKPVPDAPGIPGATVTWLPGREPRLFVDPRTGDSRWVEFGEAPPEGWQPLVRRLSPPPMTKTGLHFDPKTGESSGEFGSGQAAPDGWKPLKPIPAPPGPLGATVTWLPGREPRLYVNPRTGESRWLQSPDKPPDGWKPLRPGRPRVPTPALRVWEPRFDFDDVPVAATGGEPLHWGAPLGTAIEPVLEWAIWDPGVNVSRSLQGYINYRRGSILEWFAGNNLGRTFPAADYISGGAVGQIKSIYSTNLRYIKYGVLRRAARKLVNFIGRNEMLAGSAAELQVVVPTGTSAEVFETVVESLGPRSKVAVRVVEGLPGTAGKVLKGLGRVAGVVSTVELVQDVRHGDVAGAVGSGSGALTFALETGATVVGSTTLAVASSVTGSFALGYGVGTLINDHALPEETKSLIGETIVEFLDHGLDDIKEFYFGASPPPPTATQIMRQDGIAPVR